MDKIRVLIVEDELLVGKALSATLEDHGFVVLDVMDSGEETLNKIEQLKPDLILMDIQLVGELDGIETAERLKKILDIPVIYLTDHTDDRTVERAKATFPVGYLSKPFKDHDVLRALEIAFFNASQKPLKIQLRLQIVFLSELITSNQK